MRSSSVVAAMLIAACLPTLAKDLDPADFPVQVEVLAFQRETAVRDGGTHTNTNCLGSTNGTGTATTYDGGGTYNVQTDSTTATTCNSTTQHTQYVYRGAGMQVKIGDRVYIVECMSRLPGLYAKFSKCTPLLPGQYAARWHGSKELEIVATKSNGKFTAVTYNVTSTAYQAPEQTNLQPVTQTEQVVPTSTSGTSELSIVSAPAGAEISLDGNFVGNTPSSLNVEAGNHEISISMAGYKPWERKIRTSGGKINLNATLVQNAATTQLASSPADAQAESLADAARAARAKQAAQSSNSPQN